MSFGRIRIWASNNRDLLVILSPILLFALFMACEPFVCLVGLIVPHTRSLDLSLGIAAMTLVYLVLLVRRMRRLRQELALRSAAESRALHLATHDALTGLPNRRALIDTLDAGKRAGAPAAVLLLDLDRFKPINDTYGHEAGDATLVVLADRLSKLVGEDGLVARMGGDEFAILLNGGRSDEELSEFADRVLHAIARPVQLRGALVCVGGSIGIAFCRRDGECAEDMLRAADFAMYRAKREAGSNQCLFLPEMVEEMRDSAQLELDLGAGITRGEFIPYYQPIVDLTSGAVLGFECLARWRHPTRGLVGPDVFIPIAEEAGLIQQLGMAILRKACQDARDWPQHLSLSINISPLQLNDPWLPQRILQTLCATGFPPARLIVELTESRLLGDMEAARAILTSLKNAGVQIALDDFGTGYASMKHLRDLAFDRIKIDRSFVREMDRAENSRIIQAILHLSEGLGLPVTAEGIESAEAADWLQDLGCTTGQGYHFSRPVDGAAARRIADAVVAPPGAVVARLRPVDNASAAAA